MSKYEGWLEQQRYEGADGAQRFLDDWTGAWDDDPLLLGLTWRHLDLDGARLRVEQQLIPTEGVRPSGLRSPGAQSARSRSIA